MSILLFTKLRQLYRYRRNWRKYKHRSARGRSSIDGQLEFYSQFIRKGDLCFDVGANVGDKTDIFLQLGATVVAVEPQESCWRVLKRRFKNNANVHVVSKALDKTVGCKQISIDRSPTISSMSSEWIDRVKNSGRFASHRWGYKMTVETTAIDALIEQFGKPAFCKIDVEGYEWQVLQGLSQSVQALSLEFISEYIEPVLSCIKHLSQLGDFEFNYTVGDCTNLVLAHWAKADKISKMFSDRAQESMIQGDLYVKLC